jgi:hypothetical protein
MNDVRYDVRNDVRKVLRLSPNLESLKLEAGMREAGEMSSDMSSSSSSVVGIWMVVRRAVGVGSELAAA